MTTLYQAWTHHDGTPLCLRQMEAADAPALGRLIGGLQPGTRRRRFHGAVNPGNTAWLERMVRLDAQRDFGAVVQQHDGAVLAEARFCRVADGTAAEFALVVADDWQRHGLGALALRGLLAVACQRGVARLQGDVQCDNTPMRGLMAHMGFRLAAEQPSDGCLRFDTAL